MMKPVVFRPPPFCQPSVPFSWAHISNHRCLGWVERLLKEILQGFSCRVFFVDGQSLRQSIKCSDKTSFHPWVFNFFQTYLSSSKQSSIHSVHSAAMGTSWISDRSCDLAWHRLPSWWQSGCHSWCHQRSEVIPARSGGPLQVHAKILVLLLMEEIRPPSWVWYFIYVYLMIYKALCILGGAGFLPSTVSIHYYKTVCTLNIYFLVLFVIRTGVFELF